MGHRSDGGVERRASRREILAAAAAAPLLGSGDGRVVLKNVDRFRTPEQMFEGVRIVLAHRGERYTPAYIQGISGGAFRIAGICPCAVNCSVQMSTTDLIKLLGYEYTERILGWTGDIDDAKRNMAEVIPQIKESIRAGLPVLLWYGFADSAYEVVAGYDDAEGVFLGRHGWQGPRDGLAKAQQRRAEEAAKRFPALGALFIGERPGKLDAKAAEAAALKEAVRHARDAVVSPNGPPRQGLACYDHWVQSFRTPETKRSVGDAFCHAVYNSTHRLAGKFLREIAPRYPRAARLLREGALEFAAEADALDEAQPMIGWQSPEVDAARNERLWPLLARARDRYAAAIDRIERALPLLGA